MSKRRDIAPALGFGGGHGCRVQGVSGHGVCPAVGHPELRHQPPKKTSAIDREAAAPKSLARSSKRTRVRAREADRGASIRSKPGLLDRSTI